MYFRYTVRSILFRSNFLNGRSRKIYRPTHQLSTINQHPFTHGVSFVCLWEFKSYNLCCKVSFLYTSWVAEMNRELPLKFCFKVSLSSTETLVLVQKAYGNEALNWPNIFRWYSRFREGWELVEDKKSGGSPNSNITDVNIATVVDLVKMVVESHQQW
jgi:hypothetical protein